MYAAEHCSALIMIQKTTLVFYVLLAMHLGIILFNDQLDTQFFFVYVYFNSLHVSNIQVLIIGRFSCINTISGICHSM